jgi:single-strand DNA-binding protein
MNQVTLMGRLTKDPDVRYADTATGPMAIARYTLAVDREYKKDQSADFISCKALGKSGEFAEKYLHKGMKILVVGRIETGSFTNKEGKTIYTTDVQVQKHYFCESKGGAQPAAPAAAPAQNSTGIDGFMDIPDGIDEELPFK